MRQIVASPVEMDGKGDAQHYSGSAPFILRDIRFRQLVSRRRRFAWSIAGAMLVAYFAFILLVAYAPMKLGSRIKTDHVTTWGIPVGLGMLLYTFLLVAFYVWRVNTVYDVLFKTLCNEGQK
ncbi:DUF485 domain-containing protein [Paraburkholderia sp. J67]|uniref:DUF485 domain-containing protein n=1 Tax=Paraburkholderia sp. J67 TaxID=2805435 RepID=UPI002ABDAA05|nr:DUF485 domain-containing protein [Paraburkholderia sp. J67]